MSHALLTKRGGVQATLVPFDLLRLDGDDPRVRRIEARRCLLLRLVADAKACSAKRSPPRARSCSPRRANWAYSRARASRPSVWIKQSDRCAIEERRDRFDGISIEPLKHLVSHIPEVWGYNDVIQLPEDMVGG